jgi:hypothetical protein
MRAGSMWATGAAAWNLVAVLPDCGSGNGSVGY